MSPMPTTDLFHYANTLRAVAESLMAESERMATKDAALQAAFDFLGDGLEPAHTPLAAALKAQIAAALGLDE